MATWWKRPPRLNLLRRLLPRRRLSQPQRPNLLPFLSQYLSRRLHRGPTLLPLLNRHPRLSQPQRQNPHQRRSQRQYRIRNLYQRRSPRLLRRLCAQRLNRQPHLRRNRNRNRNRRLPLLLNRHLFNHPSPPRRQNLSQLPNLRLRQNRASPPG